MVLAPLEQHRLVTRTLLIDADILAYRATAATQQTIDWNGDGSCVSENDCFGDAKRTAREQIELFMDMLKGDDFIICLSDDVQNFRTQIDPTYKQARVQTERPRRLYDLKEWLAEKYPTELWPYLEADDVMGILATQPHKGERVMVSLDKDMKTVPGLLCRPPLHGGKWEILLSTEEAANSFHLWQTITGDQVDCYPGCPGAGPKVADKVIYDDYAYFTHEYPKGKPQLVFERQDEDDGLTDWQRLLTVYAKAGLGHAEAIVQARLAFILRDGYLVGRQPLLWEPTKTGT